MLILDRFEEGIAYLSAEDHMLAVDRYLVSSEVSEGDVLQVSGHSYIKDEEATQTRRAAMRNFLTKCLKQRS